ncbi:MAG: MFS transporter [Coriobacteriia bacterium]|nr:MFS transporter [Coriobacteriia bacterium]
MGKSDSDPQSITGGRVVRVYLTVAGLFTVSASIIWGVNTLFLLDAGLNIFQVMVVNATFSVGQMIFEVPTGVIADTVGRRASFLLGISTLVVSTLLYVASAMFEWGLPGFMGASVLLGLGFTFQTGAVDAWLVDALDFSGYPKRKEEVFARGGMVNGIAMLGGTVLGGFLGQLDLTTPYLVRSGLLVIALVFVAVYMRDIGFEPRQLKLSTFGAETRKIFDAGVRYGWRNPVVRPLLFTSAVDGLLMWYLFYAAQPYALEILGREDLIWVAAGITALFGLSGVVGNTLVGPLTRTRLGEDLPRVLAVMAGGMSGAAVLIGVVGLLARSNGAGIGWFVALAVLFAVYGVMYGVLMPCRQSFINAHIPSAQRATVLSVDSFFVDTGAALGQPGLGFVAQRSGKALAYVFGGFLYGAAAPLYLRARRASRAEAEGAEAVPCPVEPETSELTCVPGGP